MGFPASPQRVPMPENICKVQRWLDLIAYLAVRHFPVPVEELMERLPAYARDWTDGSETVRASVRRKFERDKDELRDLGIPLETVTYSINYGAEEAHGYRISQSDFYLPYLRVLQEAAGSRERDPPHADPGPATTGAPGPDSPGTGPPALFDLAPDGAIEMERDLARDAIWGLKELMDLPGFPMAQSARSAFRKFTFDLDPGMLDGAVPAEHLNAPPGKGPGGEAGPASPAPTPLDHRYVHFAIPPETARAEAFLEPLSDALLRRKKATFTYHGIERNQDTEREVRPYGLLFKHSHWYLVGWDETRGAERIFRVDRMEDVEVNPSAPATPDYEMPAEPVLERYRDRQAWELGEADDGMEATVRFRFPLSLWAARNEYGEAVEQDPDGSSVRRFEVRQANPFLRWILSLQGDAVIESPPDLAKGLQTMARQVANLYREDADA